MMEVHVCSKAGQMIRAFALGEATEVLVGRDDSCDIRIGAQSVSREHCCIERNGEMLTLRDLGSSGGTYCEGRRIERIPVRHGLEIVVGPAVLRFHDSEL